MAKTVNKTVHRAIIGKEPTACSIAKSSDPIFARGLHWYTVEMESDQIKQTCVEYAEANQLPDVNLIKKAPTYRFTSTMAGVSRMIINGWVLPSDVILRHHRKFNEIVSSIKSETIRTIKIHRKSPFDRQLETAYDLVDDLFEQFIKNDRLAPATDVFTALSEVKILPAVVNKAVERVKLYADELTDKDVIEMVGKREAAHRIAFLNGLTEKMAQYAAGKQATRKKRNVKKKVKNVLADLVYKAEDTELKLFSVDPSKIVGSDVAIIFNTALKQVSVYVAEKGNKLAIKRSSIVHFDESSSATYRFRDLDFIRDLQKVTSATKLIKQCGTIKSTRLEASGRINNNSIIVAAR